MSQIKVTARRIEARVGYWRSKKKTQGDSGARKGYTPLFSPDFQADLRWWDQI